MSKTIKEFAKHYNVPILGNTSKFPEYFASHALELNFDFATTELKSSDELNQTNLTANIDKFLGATNNVFFALGKGYLKSKDSIGLVYDPFVIAETPGATMVMNDLMYLLDGTKLLQEFCKQYRVEISSVMANTFPVNEVKDFWNAVDNNQSLLIGDVPNSPAHIFDKLLTALPVELKNNLQKVLQTRIVEPNVITSNLDKKIKAVFEKDSKLMNTFSDQTSIEKIVELQIPKYHPLTKGLIAVYIA
jgi:hypothetical protein